MKGGKMTELKYKFTVEIELDKTREKYVQTLFDRNTMRKALEIVLKDNIQAKKLKVKLQK
jgi:hypothetical protein